MKSSFGKNIKVSIWGGSHEPAIGVDITGLPIGTEINLRELEAFLKRRAPGNSPFATKRKEPDTPVPVAGLDPCGSDIMKVVSDTISLEIRNTDAHSSDYKKLGSVPRPGHADFTGRLRYGSDLNMAGGGPFSARMTAPLCIAGGIASQVLDRQGIQIGAHIQQIGNIQDIALNPCNPDMAKLRQIQSEPLAVISGEARAKMAETILAASKAGDSVGGIVEACALHVPAGIGGAMYDGLESALAPILFAIPAVKGVEFGAGFEAASLKGSQNNDPFYFDGDEIKTKTNNHGGILGGITSGMPLIVRLAFKPTPSISIPQESVNLDTKENTTLIVNGRHDPCVVTRAVPIVEAALAIGILDCLMEE